MNAIYIPLYRLLKTALVLLLVGSLFLLPSCKRTDEDGNPRFKCDNAEPDTAKESYFGFLLIDAQNSEILPLGNWEYPCFRDSIRIYKASGEPAADFSIGNSGRISFRVISFTEDHTDAFINEQVREFYLYVNYRHVDTIRFEYKFLETDCNYTVFDYARVFYNDALIIDREEETRFGAPGIYIDSLRYNPCPI